MAVPKRRTSRQQRGERRAHDALVAPQSIPCSQCGERTLRHRACPHCGNYKGRTVVEVAED